MDTITNSYSDEARKKMKPIGESHSHSLGRWGKGYIDLVTGNLLLSSDDYSWGGRKLPVTIRHGYNSALREKSHVLDQGGVLTNAADFTNMIIGYGFHINWMQRVIRDYNYVSDSTDYVRYLYTDENMNTIAFVGEKNATVLTADGYEYYPDENKIVCGHKTYRFDSSDRLYQISKEVKCSDGSTALITNEIGYNSFDQIEYVQDGAGRKFTFVYVNYELRAIVAPNEQAVSYAYTSGKLTNVHYSDGRSIQFGYGGIPPYYLTDVTIANAEGIQTYRVEYSYDSNGCVKKVSEAACVEGTWFEGQCAEFAYDTHMRKTTVKTTELDDDGVNVETTTVYSFDEDGKLVSRYMYIGEDGERVIPEGSTTGINPYLRDRGIAVKESVINLLEEHDFSSLNRWTANVESDCEGFCLSAVRTRRAKYGDYAALMTQTCKQSCKKGMYQTTDTLEAGDYTFSAYASLPCKAYGVANAGVYLRVESNHRVLYESEHLNETGSVPSRLVASFHLDEPATVQLYILVDGIASVYVSSAQLEACAYVHEYNMLYNGSFDKEPASVTASRDWVYDASVARTNAMSLNGSHSIKLYGATDAARLACQTVYGKKSKIMREAFTLRGWAKGDNIAFSKPSSGSEIDISKSLFGLMVTIKYADGELEYYYAGFRTDYDDWQYTEIQFFKKKRKAVASIQVSCVLNYATGIAYFDDIQLVCNAVEIQESESDYLDSADDIEEKDENEFAEDEVEASDNGPAELTDSYGNKLTQTINYDNEFGTMYREYAYTHSGNDLCTETDTRGNVKTYSVNEATSRNDAVTDRCGNTTVYEYDAAGRTGVIRRKDAEDNELSEVAYAYDEFDQLTAIDRADGMQYRLTYNDFHKLEAIRVNGMAGYLVWYQYKDNNGRLKSIRYANGVRMEAGYNDYGQMVSETWLRGSTVEAKYQYVYNAEGNVVRSIDNLSEKEYNYYYEDDKLVRSTQSSVKLAGDRVVEKQIDFSVIYIYDEEGKLVKKNIQLADGEEYIYTQKNPKEGNPQVVMPTGAISRSKGDKFGRKTYDELQFGRGYVSRHFTYHFGAVSGKHYENGSLKSSPVTALVKEISFQNGRTLEYEYDSEERITKLIDSEEGVTEYTYDALGQLLTEIREGVVVNTMTYDGYGNILTRNDKEYVYCDNCWNDLLKVYDGHEIVYDNNGNPISYLGHTLTWEKARQLKSFDDHTYTYNAAGIRTSKTVSGVKHTYLLEGTRILKESWGENVLIPLYNNENEVQGIMFNGTAYYFYKNLQGDVIEIVDSQANVVAGYSYDAWGVCTIKADSSEIAQINPFRYRSYYYDAEIEMYYLQSRYYNPVIGRFLNHDKYKYISSNTNQGNLFTYCANNPVTYRDDMGDFAALVLIPKGVAIGLAIAAGAVLVIAAVIITGFLVGDPNRVLPTSNEGSEIFELYLKVHHVCYGNYHCCLVIMVPDSVQRKDLISTQTNWDFISNYDCRFFTVGAGGDALSSMAGKLTGDYNRKKDILLDIAVERSKLVDLHKDDVNDIITFTEYFRENSSLPYALFPNIGVKYYNSNSFARGLLDAAKVDYSEHDPTHNVPGWDKPVPEKYFGVGSTPSE